LKAFPSTAGRLMTGMAGILDAICPVTRLAGMMEECNHNRDRPTVQGNEGKGKAMQKQRLAPRLPALPPTGVSGGLVLQEGARRGQSVSQASSKPQVFLFCTRLRILPAPGQLSC